MEQAFESAQEIAATAAQYDTWALYLYIAAGGLWLLTVLLWFGLRLHKDLAKIVRQMRGIHGIL